MMYGTNYYRVGKDSRSALVNFLLSTLDTIFEKEKKLIATRYTLLNTASFVAFGGQFYAF